MASIRKFKKEINDVLSGIIEDCYVCQLVGDDKASQKAENIIDEATLTFDELIAKLHQKDVSDMKSHLKEIKADLLDKSAALSSKIAKVSS